MYINQHLSVNIGVKIMHIIDTDFLSTEDYQFIYMQKGTVIVHYEEATHGVHQKNDLPIRKKVMLQKDDVLLFAPNQRFSCTPYTPNTLLGIRLDAPFISSIIPPGHYLECNSAQGLKKNYAQLLPILHHICATYYMEDNQYLMTALIHELTDCLKKNHIHRLSDESLSDVEQRNQERIAAITKYLQDFYHQPVSLDLLADKMFLTPQYLSKFIKKHLGTTFSRYLTSIRLEHARTELTQTEHSITNIALNNGFPNIAAFNKAFREKYELPPSVYRGEKSKKGDHKTPSVTMGLTSDEGDPNPSFLEINTSMDSIGTYQKPWMDTINIGPLPEALKVSFHNSFKHYQNTLPIKYVRFHDLFSEEIMFVDPQTNEYNLTNLDEVLQFFYNLNVIPFIELGYKPYRTHIMQYALRDESSFFKQKKEPTYYYEALSALLKHCINHFGMHYMSQWRFEFWLPHGDKVKYPSSFDGYFEQYLHFRAIVKELLPTCSFGGPGFNICSNINDFAAFLKHASGIGFPLDFISLNGFGYETQTFEFTEPNDSNGIISNNKDHILDIFLKYKALLEHAGYEALPVYITELGSSLALENYIEDSVFQAAFLCKTMLQLSPYCDCIAYLSFWDNCSDLPDSSNTYYSSSSLVDNKGIPKPALHGYSFLAKLGKNLISQGDNYIMTCNSSNHFQLLFYHYTHYNDSFCFNPWEHISLEHTYEVFCQEEALSIHFDCAHFPSGRYKAVQFSLNRTYGSALDKYLRILDTGNISSSELIRIILNLREEEARYYKQTSIPRQDIYYLNCDDTLTLNLTLEAHEVVFFEISRVF